MALTIVSYIAIIATIIHLWKLRPSSNGVCVAITTISSLSDNEKYLSLNLIIQ